MSATFAEFHDVTAYDPAVEGSSSLTDAIIDSDAIFIAVQTPHSPEYEGITDAPSDTAPFDLSYLSSAVTSVVAALNDTPTPIVIVSTVLPGDLRSSILPLLTTQPLIYNPAFVAMGTVRDDVLAPEFVLVGMDQPSGTLRSLVRSIYSPIHSRPIVFTDLESAELTKVAYNTFISQKIAFANTLMEICERLGRGNVDDVTEALSLATDRVISSRYLHAGMGDGGPCHPRDNIAMAHVAASLNLSSDPFTYVTHARQAHSRFLAGIVADAASESGLPIVLLGRSYKPTVDIETGSASLLLAHHLNESGHQVTWDDRSRPAVFVACHPTTSHLPEGSILVDPWGSESQRRVRTISVGRYR